ncbi:MAG: hypothetical protein PHD05_00520 [Sphaerochaetaceae bacterium]|jgi:hypothetical protein|nr:hypothetical protein [Sphaerochaetaceae bacterium]
MIDQALRIIEGAGVLSKNEETILNNLANDIKQTCETAQIFRTRTEMIVSVLNDIKHPTPDSKYWQAVREQNVMFHELAMLSYEYRKNKIEVKKLERKLLTEEDDLEKELIQIDIERMNFVLINMERTARDRIREVVEWSKIKAELRPKLQYGEDNVNEHQLAAMKKRFSYEASLVSSSTPPADARNILGLAKTSAKVTQQEVIGGSIDYVNLLSN